MRRLSEQELEAVRVLWREFVIASQHSSPAATGRLVQMIFGQCSYRVDAPDVDWMLGPPWWFVAYELGLADEHGPSVFEVSRRLERENKRRKRQFNVAEETREKARPKEQRRRQTRTVSAHKRARAVPWVPMDPNGENRRTEREGRVQSRREDAKRIRRLCPESRRRKHRAIAKRAGVALEGGTFCRVEE